MEPPWRFVSRVVGNVDVVGYHTQVILDPFARLIAQVIAIVLVARLIGLVARRLDQPMVIAEITAGILLGPSVLGWLWPRASTVLFPAASLELLQLVSNLGLIPFMFLVGLEFDLRVSRAHRRVSLLVSQATFLVPLVLGILLGLQLESLAGVGAPMSAFVLFLGAVLATTAFPVLARILEERQLLRSRVGAVTVTAAAIDDVLAWCLFAFVVAGARAKGLDEALLTSVLALVYVALMFGVVRPLLARLAQGVRSSAELSRDRVAALMLLLFASSWVTHAIGIHALFGAFLLGALLPREGGLAHALSEKLGDLVVVMLLPLFFAYSGVRTQIGLLDSADAWLTCGWIALVACAGKFGTGMLAARWGGLAWKESSAVGVLMNTRGLMVLIMLNIGLDLGLIGPTLFTMLVLMALFTTFLATPVLDAVYPLGSHVAELLAEHARERASFEPRVDPHVNVLSVNVLIWGGSRPRGLHALARAVADGEHGPRFHELVLRRPDESEPAGAEAHDGSEHRPLGLRQTSFVSSDPVADTCRFAEVRDAALVLLGRGRPNPREWLDEQARGVVASAKADVGVLFDAGLDRISRILVLGDPGACTWAILEHLRTLGIELVERPRAVAPLACRVDLVIVGVAGPDDAPSPDLLDYHARGISLLLVHTRT
jgi:Kef-type K+ transport system membrane component KefB